jgi:tRNA (adenine37-N6)-methyltransferase
MPTNSSSLTVEPIGYVRSARQRKFEAPHQPDELADEQHFVELLPGRQFELALHDLAGFERIWLIFWFHRNESWRPRVLPPRGPATRRGVFATRSPHRPNPIGMTNVALLGVEGLRLSVGALDLVDGTPILDIKPYLRTVDAHPESGLGWLEEVERLAQEPAPYHVEISPSVRELLDWLARDYGVEIETRAREILSRDPTPHRTRRILQLSENSFRIACGSWRLFFSLRGKTARVERIGSAYTLDTLPEGREAEAHREFLARQGLGLE